LVFQTGFTADLWNEKLFFSSVFDNFGFGTADIRLPFTFNSGVKYYLPKIGDITLASVLSYSFQEFLYNKIAAGMNVI